ncbi:ROK family protein [Catellatospora sp. KI3]|uniref:polyphosphate--glucose phosphotransferase n=1 Tax=Catellatospora sp. KI3 TaxID=3041620 RepID=UPI002482DD24|nr:ROK family protein [Catellatospora sp. KI3]MDI1463960.1 ROK family protein [Catellatospora sp. KI3]
MAILGIDIGGSGIKGAPVDLEQGVFAEERVRLETPQPSDVTAVVATVAEVAGRFPGVERVGVTFPGVVQGGVTRTAANVDHSWIGAPARDLFTEALGVPVVVLNDADAAGIAEMTYGAGKGRKGVTIMLTFGTGIGSAVFIDDRLVPNTELGHIQLHGEDAERRASAHAREVEDLGWKDWAKRVQDYLRELERLLNPDLMIIGGGVSKKAEKFLPHIDVRTPLVPAALLNDAGIVGAALAATQA